VIRSCSMTAGKMMLAPSNAVIWPTPAYHGFSEVFRSAGRRILPALPDRT
jgi:DNA-binding transcriptional MocR family regulator